MDAFNLDQMTVFVAVADAGSFAAAARRLGRAHSVITYTVQKLEEQTGLTLFDRSAYRASLTPEGLALLPGARRVLEGLAAFRSQAGGLRAGNEAQVVLCLSALAPVEVVSSALLDFQAAFPDTPLWLTTQWQAKVAETLLSGGADLALIGAVGALPPELEGDLFGHQQLVAVAAPDHPLAGLTGPIQPEALEAHTQIIVTEFTLDPGATHYGALSPRQWYVTDLRAKHTLLKAGAGWGGLPLSLVEADLKEGKLVQLHPTRWDGADRLPRIDMMLVRAKNRPLGPAASWLWRRLAECDPG